MPLKAGSFALIKKRNICPDAIGRKGTIKLFAGVL